MMEETEVVSPEERQMDIRLAAGDFFLAALEFSDAEFRLLSSAGVKISSGELFSTLTAEEKAAWRKSEDSGLLDATVFIQSVRPDILDRFMRFSERSKVDVQSTP